MVQTIFAATDANSSGLGALGISPSAFLIQLIPFVIVVLLLRVYAFKPIGKLLEERRKTIDDGVRMGQKMEKEKIKFDADLAKVLRDARVEADKIISIAHKDAREVVREAEKTAGRKAEAMIADAEVRIEAETERAKLALEDELIGLVSEATEAIVGEKVDVNKDRAIIDKIIKQRAK